MIESSEAYQEAVIADARRVRVKAVVDIIDPDMKRGAINGVWQDMDVSRIDQLWNHKFENTANYASCERGRWLLDGETPFLPDEQPDWEIGMVCGELSGADGKFVNGQWAELNFSNVGILQACSVAFSDDPVDGVGEEFTVEVFSEGVAYYTEHVKGNKKTLVSLYGFRVNNPDKLKVTVTKWSLPGRRARILELVSGIYEVWTGDELEENGFNVKHQGDPSCLTLPYGTATIRMDNQDRRFDPRNPKGVFLSIQERQGIELHMGVELSGRKVEYKGLGVFYQSGDGWKTSDGEITMQWNLVDIIGMIAKRRFSAPSPLPTTLGGWLAALVGQLGENFKDRWYAAPELASLPVTIREKPDHTPDIDAIKGLTCGDILRYVCMATGTWPRADASTSRLLVEKVRDDGNEITLDNLSKYPTMTANRDVAYVTVGDYTHYGNNTAASETINVANPLAGPQSNMDMTRNILSLSCGGDKFSLLGRGDPASEIGDVDVIHLMDGVALTARRTMQELAISGGVLRNCRSTLIRTDGMFSFTNRVQLLESGVFQVPAGVYRIRVILIGAGSDGTAGGDGDWNRSYRWDPFTKTYPVAVGTEHWEKMGHNGYGYAPWYIPGETDWDGTKLTMYDKDGNEISNDRDIVYGTGAFGGDGKPGKIWEGVIDVNAGQEIQISVAQKAPQETTFWKYSSANGTRGGFRDIATGEYYGGLSSKPVPGSGNAGRAGDRGMPGYWHEETVNGETVVIADYLPTAGTVGSKGSSGSVIIYWENPYFIEG